MKINIYSCIQFMIRYKINEFLIPQMSILAIIKLETNFTKVIKEMLDNTSRNIFSRVLKLQLDN